MISQRKLMQTMALTVALMTGSVMMPGSSALKVQAAGKATGRLLVSGPVSVNGLTAAPGISVVSQSRIRTGADGTAVVSLGRLGRIELGPGSQMILQLADKEIGGNLIAGSVLVSAAQGTAVALNVADATVTTDGQKASVVMASVEGHSSRIATIGGSARVSHGSKVEVLGPGQQALLSLDAAGKVGRDGQIGAADAALTSRIVNNRGVVDTRLGPLLGGSVGQAGDTVGGVSGDTSRPATGGTLPTRSRRPDIRNSPPQGFDSQRARDVSRIIP